MVLAFEVEKAVHPLRDLAFGAYQAAMLILLTLLFGSTYGLRLFYSLGFVVGFAVILAISRALSIAFCAWMAKALSFTIITCANVEEKENCKNI